MRISDWSSDVCSSDLVVECDAEGGEVGLVPGLHAADEVLGRKAGLFRGQHDRRAMGVVGADEVHGAAGQAARAHQKTGRASWRGRGGQYVEISGVADKLKKKKTDQCKHRTQHT